MAVAWGGVGEEPPKGRFREITGSFELPPSLKDIKPVGTHVNEAFQRTLSESDRGREDEVRGVPVGGGIFYSSVGPPAK